MACNSCKEKNKEKYRQIESELKTYDWVVRIVVGSILVLSLYGLYSLIRNIF